MFEVIDILVVSDRVAADPTDADSPGVKSRKSRASPTRHPEVSRLSSPRSLQIDMVEKAARDITTSNPKFGRITAVPAASYCVIRHFGRITRETRWDDRVMRQISRIGTARSSAQALSKCRLAPSWTAKEHMDEHQVSVALTTPSTGPNSMKYGSSWMRASIQHQGLRRRPLPDQRRMGVRKHHRTVAARSRRDVNAAGRFGRNALQRLMSSRAYWSQTTMTWWLPYVDMTLARNRRPTRPPPLPKRSTAGSARSGYH